jgi:hypothetical protein
MRVASNVLHILFFRTNWWVTRLNVVIGRLNSAPLRCHRCGCEFRKSLDGAISETGKNRG